jgi:hypothetical protein
MSDLSQSLIDAAAAEDWRAHHEAMLKVITQHGSRDEKTRRMSTARSRAVVVVVLETLAALTAPTPPDGPARVQFLNHEEFKRLAAEVREGTP